MVFSSPRAEKNTKPKQCNYLLFKQKTKTFQDQITYLVISKSSYEQKIYINDTLQINGWAFKLNLVWHSAGGNSRWTKAWGKDMSAYRVIVNSELRFYIFSLHSASLSLNSTFSFPRNFAYVFQWLIKPTKKLPICPSDLLGQVSLLGLCSQSALRNVLLQLSGLKLLNYIYSSNQQSDYTF